MLTCYLLNRSGKRRIATQPLIGYNSQGILIAGRTWFTPSIAQAPCRRRNQRLSEAAESLENVCFGQ